MKKREKKNFIKWSIVALCIGGFFALFFYTLVSQYRINGGRDFALLHSRGKYIVWGLAMALFTLTVLFIALACTRGERSPYISPEFFGVDFEKEEKHKAKLKSVEPSDRIAAALEAAQAKTDAEQNVAVANASGSGYAERAHKREIESGEEEENGSRFYMLT
ncbi:MAG: hypothetical protein K2L51_02135, partial [Clostridiales bacterium]|nr:hypothetical protein [Clostridiales bacterium]